MYKVEVKYSRIAIPHKEYYTNLQEAKKYKDQKLKNNPYVRWITITNTETGKQIYPEPIEFVK